MRALVLAVTILAGCAGRLPPPAAPVAATGWIDFSRVRAESALGKRLDDEHATVVKSRQEEAQKISADLAAAEKRRDKDIESEKAVATRKVQQLNAEIDQHETEVRARLVAAVQPIASKLGAEQHLAHLDFEVHLWAAGDLTDEVIRRLDAETYRPPGKSGGAPTRR